MKQSFESAGARDRILDAAETLFGNKGIHPTSIRDITASAKVNLAAVNYHFRSKEGLLAAVLARRTEPINRERLRMLESFEEKAAGRPLEVEQILEAFLAPTLSFLLASPSFLKFAGRMFSEPDPKLRQILMERFQTLARRFVGALQRSLPEAEEADLWWSFLFLVGGMVHTWTNHGDLQRLGTGTVKPVEAEAVIGKLIRFASAGFRAQGLS